MLDRHLHQLRVTIQHVVCDPSRPGRKISFRGGVDRHVHRLCVSFVVCDGLGRTGLKISFLGGAERSIDCPAHLARRFIAIHHGRHRLGIRTVVVRTTPRVVTRD